MSKRLSLLLIGILAVTAISAMRNRHDSEYISQAPTRSEYRNQVAQTQIQSPRQRRVIPNRRSDTRFGRISEPKFTPIRNLFSLQSRGCEDEDLSSFILQSKLIKKDRRLAWQQHDIDDCNAMVLSYVERSVRENQSYYLLRKLVETFGQTNRKVLINRLRLVAVILGGEKGQGGMDPVFTPIREEAHRISPYVIVQVRNYIAKLEATMKRAMTNQRVDEKFKKFVDTLGESHQSGYGIANIGAQNRNQPARELYALNVLLRDLREYYGERVERADGSPPYEVIFSDLGTFKSETLTNLSGRHRSMKPNELAKSFVKLGLELREHLSQLRGKRTSTGWRDDEEIHHLQKLNEIVATLTGLFGAGRVEMDASSQTRSLVDLLFLEGLYSKKDRKSLIKELDEGIKVGPKHEKQTRAYYSFLNHMNGLAFAKMDEALGDAARAYSKLSREAENYMEVQARKSALQILGQLQLEFYNKHQKILAGTKDIHLTGTARGKLRVFQSQREIATFLRNDALNGAGTIWVLKSGLNMPNQASFAAILVEDPIMKASHYDGYARSKKPPITLLQISGAAKSYAKFNGKNVVLEATKRPEKVVIKATSSSTVPKAVPAGKRIRLAHQPGHLQLYEIDAAKSHEEIRAMQKQVGAKAANYAFLVSA